MALVDESFALAKTASSGAVVAKGRARSGTVEKGISGKASGDEG